MKKNQKDVIQGKRVVLWPATEQDRRSVYEWLTRSDITPSIMGMPSFPDHPVPTWEEFCADYEPYYFDGSRPESGRCFIIIFNGMSAGQINYNNIDFKRHRAELDIWMNAEAYCGKGYGPDALTALCGYLSQAYGVVEFVLRPSARNLRAIRAYKKAGFRHVELSRKEQEAEYGPGDYEDTVVLVRHMPKPQDQPR
jgi:RimJ/RimL family protein N-acetyltransferase